MAESKEAEVEKTIIQEPQPGISPSLTEEEKELAANAYEEFEKRNFDACIACLNKLLVTRPKDPKILHNYAVAEYYASDFVKTKQYRQKVAELCQQSHINIENVDSLEDVDHCVIYFNQAVILFHLHQYFAAIAILDKLFQFIEPLDEHLTRKVCFLLLELYLSTHQPEKALGLIGYIENMLFGSGSSGIGNGGKGHKAPTPEKDGKEREGSREKDNHNKELSELNRNELYRPKLQHYKARCYIMLKSTKACKREIKNLMSSGVSIPAIFLRSQLEYLRGNYRKAIKVLNTAFSGSSVGGGRPYKDTGDNLNAMFYNNLGCIHFYMGKPNLGAYYFTKALQEHQNGTASITMPNADASQPLMSRPLQTLDITAGYQMLYNLGLQFLHSGKPQLAFDHLIEAVQVYPNNPRLWLRIAECCIQAHKADNSVDFQQKDRKTDLLHGTVGSGTHKKILLKPSLPDKNKHSMAGSAMPVVSLEFACLCLSNALLLLPEEGTNNNYSETKEEQKQSTSSTPTTPSQDVTSTDSIMVLPVPPSNSLQKSETWCLRNSIIAAHAYVSLCLGNVLVSLKHAETLLAQPKISGAHRFLGHLYAAESLLLLDRIGEAIQHLNPELISDVSLHLPSGEDGKPAAEDRPRIIGTLAGWYPTSICTAKVVLQYNLAVAYTLRGELEKASDVLRLVASAKGPNTEFPLQAVMLAIYIQLQQGHVDLAKTIIKQNLPQYR